VAAKPVAASAPLTPPAIVTELNIIFNSGPLASAPPTVAATPKTYTAPRPTTAAASDTDSTSSTPVTAATAVTSPETLPAPAAGPAAIKATNTGLVERKPTITQAVTTGDNGTAAQTDHPPATKEPTLIKAPDPSDNAAAVIAVAEPPPPRPRRHQPLLSRNRLPQATGSSTLPPIPGNQQPAGSWENFAIKVWKQSWSRSPSRVNPCTVSGSVDSRTAGQHSHRSVHWKRPWDWKGPGWPEGSSHQYGGSAQSVVTPGKHYS
jgi:hypothetical protein